LDAGVFFKPDGVIGRYRTIERIGAGGKGEVTGLIGRGLHRGAKDNIKKLY
jgi:hypothetical protein